MSDLYKTDGISVRMGNDLIYPPTKCCELCVYDNDGPEGLFARIQAERSSDLVKFINLNYAKEVEDGSLNFIIENHWNKK